MSGSRIVLLAVLSGMAPIAYTSASAASAPGGAGQIEATSARANEIDPGPAP